MCGLVGVASRTPQRGSWLSVAGDTLNPRGPADGGEWWSTDGRVGLAHRRLAILDLSSEGHQPMHRLDRGLSIVFNGEIYNFDELRAELEQRGSRFSSSGDTEVLLEAYAVWGADFISRLNGMFAFAIYDSFAERLLLARDRAGEKPLFYRLQGGSIFFASELKALLAHPTAPRRIDPVALDLYLATGYVPGDGCILEGYRKLPPAHAMSFDLRMGSAKVWRYWNLPDYEADTYDEVELVDELEVLLERSVRRQTRADVPVGILLSGGVDSSLVTAMAARHLGQVRTFSVRFPGGGPFDETSHARLIARHFATDHTELQAHANSAELVPDLAAQFDEPIADLSMIPTFMVSQLVKAHCTVALGGDGGDELFGGYHYYTRLLMYDRMRKLLPAPLRKILASFAENVLPVGLKGRSALRALHIDTAPQATLSFFDPATRMRLLPGRAPFGTANNFSFETLPVETDLIQQVTRLDFSYYLPDDILAKVDRASMLNSLEVRSPFLDYPLVEFAFRRVPPQLKAVGNQRKIILKLLTERLLPPNFDRIRKHGFGVPIDDWLKDGVFRDLVWDTLGRADSAFDREETRRLLRGQDLGLANGHRLFALLIFELWREHYGAIL